MTNNYTLTAGPSKYDLLVGLTEKKLLTFRAKNKAGQVTLFEVVIIGLTLSSKDANASWEIKGLIASKNRKRSEGPFSKCRVIFDTQKRTGHFDEIDSAPTLYSFEYFEQLSDVEILEKIAKLKKCLPADQQEFEDYKRTLDAHSKLVLEGVKTWGLLGAYVGTKTEHEIILMQRELTVSKGS